VEAAMMIVRSARCTFSASREAADFFQHELKSEKLFGLFVSFKVGGSAATTKSLPVGFNFLFQSGKKASKLFISYESMKVK